MATDLYCTAEDYANTLLRDVGITARAHCAAVHPALRAAQCGLNALTGQAGGPAQLCPAPLAVCADGALAALSEIGDMAALKAIDGAALLGERAACFGYTRRGAISAGGSCRLLSAADGWLAVNLTRDADWDLLSAWLESPVFLEAGSTRNWQSVANVLRNVSVNSVVERARMLGLAVSAMTAGDCNPQPWLKSKTIASKYPIASNATAVSRLTSNPLVIDLSSLWAGPLCGHLLQMLGARVIKVESTQRPDGARFGEKSFFDLLNAHKECVALNLDSEVGREQLRQLLLRADIVIEASRPRALRHMAIFAEDIVAQNPALTWVSISGYGREEPNANWIAFGDDAGVAAGLSQLLFEVTSEPMFCGDAIADPLTGMHAALAAWASYLGGGGKLLSLSLRDVVAHCIRAGGAVDAQSTRKRYRDWMAMLGASSENAAAPRARKPAAIARLLGADTQSVLAEFDIAC